MAQSVEQLICNLQVMGSSPFTSSRKKQKALTEISVRAFFVPMRHLPAGPFCEVSSAGRQIIHLLGMVMTPDLAGKMSGQHVNETTFNKFAALLAAICARIGSRKAKSKAGEIPPFFVSPVVVWGMEVSAYAGA